MKSSLRLLAAALTVAMALTLLTACGSGGEASKVTTKTTAAVAGEETGSADPTGDEIPGNETQAVVTDPSGAVITQTPATDKKGNPVTQKPGTVKTTSKGEGTKSVTPTKGGDKKLVGNTYTAGFPIVKDKETINIMAITRPDVGDQAKSRFTTAYSKMTNMTIKWTLVTEGNASTRKTLALQSGGLPDVFAIGSSYISEYDMLQYSAEGSIKEIPLDMLKTYGPNIVKAYDQYPNAWNIVKDEKGKMYELAGFTKDNPYGLHYLWVRKTWLDNLGLAVPTTMDAFYNMLVAFKNMDPNGNGDKDEIPYATWHHGGFFTIPWGVNTGICADVNGKVVHSYTTDNMKKALTYWKKVYNEGLVNKDVIDNWAGENAAFKTLCAGGKVGVIYYGWPNGFLPDALFKEYVAMPWPTAGNNGSFPSVYFAKAPVEGARSFVITKACKNIPAAIRFLDYLYTNDGYMLEMYGEPGYLYTKVNDKTYKATGKQAAANEPLGPNWTMCGRHFLEGAAFEKTETLADRQYAAAFATLEKQTQQLKNVKTIPNIRKTKSELDQIKVYDTYFSSIANSWYDYITGKADLGTDWTALQNQMASKGLGKYVGVYQSYYDRANKT